MRERTDVIPYQKHIDCFIFGGSMRDKIEIKQNDAPSGGWGSVKEVSAILLRENVVAQGTSLLLHQNKPDGFACVSCAWAKPANPHPAEFCESGAKATAWEITSHTLKADFFASHTLTALESWSDHELEAKGRLTELLLLWEEVRFTLLFVTHSIEEALVVGNRILLPSLPVALSLSS